MTESCGGPRVSKFALQIRSLGAVGCGLAFGVRTMMRVGGSEPGREMTYHTHAPPTAMADAQEAASGPWRVEGDFEGGVGYEFSAVVLLRWATVTRGRMVVKSGAPGRPKRREAEMLPCV